MKNQTDTIVGVLDYLNNDSRDGGFWLPHIQRHFVWSQDQIVRLFDSIMRQYPISTMLVWRTDEKVRFRSFVQHFRSGMSFSKQFEPPSTHPRYLILDGQQRFQALYIGLRGSYDTMELWFDILSGDLAAPEDIRFKFEFADEFLAGWPLIKFKDLIFNKETSSRRIARELEAKATKPLTDQQKERIADNVELARTVFRSEQVITYQKLDAVDTGDLYRTDDVVEIFIRANSGGTKLSKSDLLFSLLSSSWDESEDAMEQLLDELNQGEFEFDRDFVLKVCLAVLGKGARYEVEKFRDGKTRETILGKWDAIGNAIKDIKDFIVGRTFIRCGKLLPSYLALIPLIYLRYHYPQAWKIAQSDAQSYLIRCLMTGAFSGSPDNLIDRLINGLDELKRFDHEDVYRNILDMGRNLEITPEALLGQSYGSDTIHLFLAWWYDSFNYTPAYAGGKPQVDHIFPQSVLSKERVSDPQTKRSTMRYRKDVRDQIANCMLLKRDENGSAGKTDTLPEKWFSDKDEEYLELHQIPRDKTLWKLEHFDDFLEARKILLLKRFEPLLRKEVHAAA